MKSEAHKMMRISPSRARPAFRLWEWALPAGVRTRSRPLFFFLFRFLIRGWNGSRISASWPVDQFDHAHIRTIAPPRLTLDNPRVAAVAVGIPGTDLVKKLCHNAFVGNGTQNLAAGMQITPFRKGDQTLGGSPEFLRFRRGCMDSLVFNQRGYHVSEHRLEMTAVAVQFCLFVPVYHSLLRKVRSPLRWTSTIWLGMYCVIHPQELFPVPLPARCPRNGRCPSPTPSSFRRGFHPVRSATYARSCET